MLKFKRAALCGILTMLMILSCLPLCSSAEGQAGLLPFSTFEKLQQLCEGASELSEAFLICTSEDRFLISSDLVIPPGTTVTFRSFTVSEGVTLTVSENARLLTEAMRIEGELTNEGTVIQQKQLSGNGLPEIEIAAWVPGHITNRGEMILTDLYGTRNVLRRGGSLVINETDLYRKRTARATEEPKSTPEPEKTPEPAKTGGKFPSDRWRFRLMRFMDVMEEILPKASFFLVLLVLFYFIRAGLKQRRGEKRAERSTAPQVRGQAPSGKTADIAHEDHFQHDRQNRIRQLDNWLQSGLIDRKEYRALKKKFENEKP